ncbi:MAG TPA: hypothetical protein VIV60_26345 [Polyangiaceae bacterium]
MLTRMKRHLSADQDLAHQRIRNGSLIASRAASGTSVRSAPHRQESAALAWARARILGAGPSPAAAQIQRRIMIAGKPYKPTAKYYRYLTSNFGPAMKEFVESMHHDGNPPDYAFSNNEQMGNEVRVRSKAIQGMEAVHAGCCDYFSDSDPPYLNVAYWDKVGPVSFVPKTPLPAGKTASDAIEAIFASGAKTRLECLSMTIAIEYYSLLKGLGRNKFDTMFPGGAGIEISAKAGHPLLVSSNKKYTVVAVTNARDLLPGDWVYFKNFTDYLTRHPGGYWQGENAIYMGLGKYRGFGLGNKTEGELNAELVDQYNQGLAASEQRTIADLLAEGGGLLRNPVARPEIAKIAP